MKTTAKTAKLLWIIGLIVLLLAAVAVRCWNAGDVFIAGEVFFADPDCYSRMTRVQQIVEAPGTVIGRHEFENWPDGVAPHTTAPADYVIAVAAWLIGLFYEKTRALNLAGAWTPVLIGVLAVLYLWRWARDAAWSGTRWVVASFFIISPMLVHGTALGRPDHQALVILFLTMALGAEAAIQAGWGKAKMQGVIWGASWGTALWVSLYEPGIFFIASLLLVMLLNPRSLMTKERLAGWLMLLGIIGVALLIEGWKSPLPDEEVIRAFPNWAATIGELRSLPLWSPILLQWSATTLPLAFILLPWLAYRQKEQRRPALYTFGLLLVATVLTCWQVRWGYFLGVAFALSLPWQLAALRRRWVVIVFLTIGSLVIIEEWAGRLGSGSESEQAQRFQQRREKVALRDLAYRISAQARDKDDRGAILAPWWQSPALAYWTGLPCVAGSSHQSLPGTLDTARFYLSTDPAAALELVAQRRVSFVVVYEPQYLLQNSAEILGAQPVPEDEEASTMGGWLYRRPNSPPPGFLLLGGNPYFRLFSLK